jgi:predicted metalloprotease
MRWQDGRRDGNIEDRRGMSGGRTAGGVGLGGVVIALIGYFVFGIDPSTTLSVVGGGQPSAQVGQQEGVRGSPRDQAAQFVDVVETSNTDVWSAIFKASGQQYRPAAGVVLYDEATPTGCGTGQTAMGPFYCPADQKVYLDLSFWQELETKFGASGDFARAYVVAHEIGHHVQNLTGQMDRGQRMGARGEDSGSVRTELQADCYAGVWASHAGEVSGGSVAIDGRDIQDGLAAAASVGDDTIQRRTQGRVVPDAFTHGTSEQRMRWFQQGYRTGDPGQCDTFRARDL